MNYIISVDSGGTKTEAIAYDLKGNVIARAKTGFGNLLVEKEEALKNLKQAVFQLLKKLGMEKCQRVIIGVAGIDSGNFRQEIMNAFQKISDRLSLMNDAWLSYYSIVKKAEGCLIIAGTGSICIGKKADKEYRVGGWGHLLGDEGSGYWLATQVIKQLLYQEDRGKPYSLLSLLMLSHLKGSTISEVVKYVYTHTKDQVAALAEVVVKGAELGDEEAIALLKQAGQELGKQAQILLTKMELSEEVTIGLAGSVLSKNDYVYDSFVSTVSETKQDITFVRETESSTIGGYYFYQTYFR